MSVQQAITSRNSAKADLANIENELASSQFVSAEQRDIIAARINDLKSQKTELQSKVNSSEVGVLVEIDKDAAKTARKQEKKDEKAKKLYAKIKNGLKGTSLQKSKLEKAKFAANNGPKEAENKPNEQKGLSVAKDSPLAYGSVDKKRKKDKTA